MPDYIEYPTIECAFCLIPLTRDPLPLAFPEASLAEMAAKDIQIWNGFQQET
jgi:hypothetical protein